MVSVVLFPLRRLQRLFWVQYQITILQGENKYGIPLNGIDVN